MRHLPTLLLVVALLYTAACSPEPPEPAGSAEDAVRIVVEADSPLNHAEPATIGPAEGATGGRALLMPDESLPKDGTAPDCTYRVTVEQPGRYALWLRTRWQDGCGNSLAVALAGGRPLTVGNDGTYGTWHWVKGGHWELPTGEHELVLHWREDGLALDQMLLTTDLESWPDGPVGQAPTASAGPDDADNAPLPPEQAGPVLPELQPEEPRPYRAAVGGAYRSGFEGALVRLGVPVDRLHGRELVEPDTLANFDLICLTSPNAPAGRHVQALEAWVRQGGTLVAEFTGPYDHLAPANEPDSLLNPRDYRNRHGRLETGCRVLPDESKFFDGVEEDQVFLAADVRCGRLDFEPAKGTGIELFGRVMDGRRELGAAIMRRPFGKGRLYFLAAPLGFHSMWRGSKLDGVLENVLRDAVGEDCRLLYADMPHDNSPMPGLLFADDFMAKTRKVGDSWRIESGKFTRWLLFRPNIKDAFSMHGEGPGVLAAVGNPNWTDYRVSASVKGLPGTAGVWVGLSDGARVRLLLDSQNARLHLQHVLPKETVELASTSVSPRPGWRRLSLFRRGERLAAYLDGVQALSVPAGELGTVQGRFGVAVAQGKALFDDVAVRRVDALLPGTDRAPGEEGSCMAVSSITGESIEARNLYTQQWHLPPAFAGDGHLQLPLPLYAEGMLWVDGEPLARVEPGTDPARVLLPWERRPRRSVSLRAPGWQDYVFSARMTDWYSRDEWAPQPRWSCDPDWQWPGVDARKESVLWHKRTLEPPYAMAAYIGAASVRWLRGGHYGRDLNLVLGGNGRDLAEGLTVRIMDRDGGVQLWRGDQRLATAKGVGLPDGHSLHHIWWEIKAIVDPGRVRVFFDGRLAIYHELEAPLAPGQVGIWTRRNAVSVGRVTLSTSPPASPPEDEPATVSAPAGAGGES
jgi:hypothetical protein